MFPPEITLIFMSQMDMPITVEFHEGAMETNATRLSGKSNEAIKFQLQEN